MRLSWAISVASLSILADGGRSEPLGGGTVRFSAAWAWASTDWAKGALKCLGRVKGNR